MLLCNYRNLLRYCRKVLFWRFINAFCHRDYRDPDLFKNRVEIHNPGGWNQKLLMLEQEETLIKPSEK